jgi:tetratricopeptide (TPR) repeat protein
MRTWLLVIFAAAAFLVGAGDALAENLQIEYKFAKALSEHGYYDLAIERLLVIRESLKPQDELYDDVCLCLVASHMAAAREVASPQEQLDISSRAIAEMETLLKASTAEEEQCRLKIELGKMLLGYGQIAMDLLLNKREDVDFAKTKDAASDAFARAMKALEEGSKGYQSIVKRIEEKKNLDDPDRRKRLLCLQQQVVAENETGWTHYRLAEFAKVNGETQQRAAELAAAAKIFDDLSVKHADIAAGVSATLGKGRVLQEQGEAAKAISAFDQVLSVDPAGAVVEMHQLAYYHKAIAQRSVGRFDEAVATLNTLMTFNRKSPQARGVDGGAIQLAYAQTVAAQAEALEKLAQEAGKKTDAASVAKARDLSQQSVAKYKEAAKHVRQLARPGSLHTREAFRLWGEWMAKAGEKAERTAAEWYAEGEQFFGSKKYMDAAKSYRVAVCMSAPSDDKLRQDAWLQMGQAYAMAGRNYEAGLILEYASRQYPKSLFAESAAVYSSAYLGDVYAKGKTPLETDAYLESQFYLLKTYPNNAASQKAALRVADLFRAQQQHVQAATAYAAVPASSPYYERARYQCGASYWTAYLKAKAGGEPAVELRTKSVDCLTAFVDWCTKSPDPGGAAARERAVYGSLARISVAEIYLHEDFNAAVKAIDVLAPLDAVPKVLEGSAEWADIAPRVLVLQVQAYCLDGKLDVVEAKMKRLMEDTGASPDQKAIAARAAGGSFVDEALKAGKDASEVEKADRLRQLAAEYLMKSVELKPDQALDDYALIARRLYQAGMYSQAGDVFAQLADRFKDDPKQEDLVWQAREWVGRCAMESGNWQDAISVFRQVLEKYPRSMSVHQRLALSLERLNTGQSSEEAVREWRLVERTLRQGTPDWFEARYHLAVNLAALKKKDLAYETVSSTAISHPGLGGMEWKEKFTSLVANELPEYQDKFAELEKASTQSVKGEGK